MTTEELATQLGLDHDNLAGIIENASQMEEDEAFFGELSKISKAKAVVEDLLEQVVRYELTAKSYINAKAKNLYGQEWQVIKGHGFKINRSPTGQLYEILDEDKVGPEFLKVRLTANAKAIETYRETHDNSLPKGVGLNENRGESIRIMVRDDDND